LSLYIVFSFQFSVFSEKEDAIRQQRYEKVFSFQLSAIQRKKMGAEVIVWVERQFYGLSGNCMG